MLAPISLLHELIRSDIPKYPSVTGLLQPITARSLAGFFYALGWGWLLLVAFTGWGRLTGKLFRTQHLPASIACSLGIAMVIFIGGWINLVHAIYAVALFIIVAVGLLLYLALHKDRPEGSRWRGSLNNAPLWARIFIVLALLLISLRASTTIRVATFDSFDDGPAYLSFPQKMLALHSYAADPFSDRRVTSSLGGSYFLQVFVITGTSLANIAMVDRTLGLILLVGSLYDIGIAFELSVFQIALLEFLAFLIPQPTINLTFIILPSSMLLGMLWIILKTREENAFESIRYAFLAGAIGGSVISLKSTYLPIVGAFALLPYSLMYVKNQRSRLRNLPLAAALGSLTILAAWMVAMKLTSGTYLFPILGRGFDYSAYGQFSSHEKFYSARSFLKIFLQGFALLALAGFLFLFTKLRDRKTRFSFWVLISSAVAITAFNYKSGGDSIWRYNFPQFFIAIVIFYVATAFLFHTQPRSISSRAAFCIGILAMFGMIFYYDASGKSPKLFRQTILEFQNFKPSLHASLNGLPLANSKEQQRYHNIEASLPVHAVALENTAYPYLLDNHGPTIFIADWPAAASLPPGWPFPVHVDSFVNYLNQHSIRYVIYDYGYARWNDVEGCKALESPNLNSEWLQDQWRMSLVAHNQFNHLRARYSVIYDDGEIVVIDLLHPIPNAPLEKPLWTLQESKDTMCSTVMARYLAAKTE